MLYPYLENDPGKDLGMLRQPGHRFFFHAGEVEPLAAGEILVGALIQQVICGAEGASPDSSE